MIKIKKGDNVIVIKGKDKGRRGKVLKVSAGNGQVAVDGLNVFKKHLKGDGKKRQSAIIDISKPVKISNLMFVCPSCDKPSRVGVKMESGIKIRVCKKCGKTVSKLSAKKVVTKKKTVKQSKKTTKK